jgi:adenosylcobyric acid synthase
VLEEVSDVVWARTPQQLVGADLVVLPGSKHVAADLDWLLARGFALLYGSAPPPTGQS